MPGGPPANREREKASGRDGRGASAWHAQALSSTFQACQVRARGEQQWQRRHLLVHAVVHADKGLLIGLLEVVRMILELLLELALDVVAHKVRARVAVDAMAVEYAEKDLVLAAVELRDDFEGVLVSLVQIFGIVAALRQVRVAQRDARVAKLEQLRLRAADNPALTSSSDSGLKSPSPSPEPRLARTVLPVASFDPPQPIELISGSALAQRLSGRRESMAENLWPCQLLTSSRDPANKATHVAGQMNRTTRVARGCMWQFARLCSLACERVSPTSPFQLC